MIFLLMKAYRRYLILAGALMLVVSCVAPGPSSKTTSSSSQGTAENPVIDSTRLPARLDYEDLARLLEDETADLLLLDVRTPEEFNLGHIGGAVLSPYDSLETMFREQDKDRPIVVYCRSGNRSSIALRTLTRMGYTNVSDFGGIGRWGGSLVQP